MRPIPRAPAGVTALAPLGRRGGRRACWAVLVALAALALPASQAPRAAPARPSASLAGRLLVATADMPDPRFARSVIYMVRHDGTGAMGLIVNRAIGEVPLARLLDHAGMPSEGVAGSVRLHAGGPVEPLRVFVLHTADYSSPATTRITPEVGLTVEPDILQAIAAGKGPRLSLFALGYAGWAPGQLEGEMDSGAWVSVATDESLVFGEEYERKWERALARLRLSI